MSKRLCKRDKKKAKKKKMATYTCIKCDRTWHTEKRLCKPVPIVLK